MIFCTLNQLIVYNFRFKLPSKDKAEEAAQKLQHFLSRSSYDDSLSRVFKTPVKENSVSRNLPKTPINVRKSPMPSPFLGSPGKYLFHSVKYAS